MQNPLAGNANHVMAAAGKVLTNANSGVQCSTLINPDNAGRQPQRVTYATAFQAPNVGTLRYGATFPEHRGEYGCPYPLDVDEAEFPRGYKIPEFFF